MGRDLGGFGRMEGEEQQGEKKLEVTKEGEKDRRVRRYKRK